MNFLLLLVFGIAVGVLSGLLGLGGGIVLVPGLMLMFGFSQPEAQGTSLAVLIPPIGLFAAIVYYQHGYIRLPVVGWIAAGFVIGAFFGAHLVSMIPVKTLRIGFGLLLLYEGFTFVMGPATTRKEVALPAGVATIGAALTARLLRRSRVQVRPQPTPPDEETEYHI
jgi:uncharacterized protein